MREHRPLRPLPSWRCGALYWPACCGSYMINVASAKYGVGYGAWSHIDGWSKAVAEYIRELERTGGQ